MTEIIAYGTVVRAPQVIGFPLPQEERSIGFSVVVEEDFDEADDIPSHRRALYRVVLTGEHARYIELNLKVGASVLVKGEVFLGAQLMMSSAWNHRVVFGDEVVILAGELPQGRAYPLDMKSVARKIAVGE